MSKVTTKKPDQRKGTAVVNFLVYVTPQIKNKLDKLTKSQGYSSRAELVRRIFNDYCADK